MSELYTKYPRTTLWLLEEGDVVVGGEHDDAKPHFEAEVRPIYIGKIVITNEHYEAYDPAHERSEMTSGDDDPVVNVSFCEAIGYCQWYSELSGKSFRLPTEIEWEYACRADSNTRYHWGDSSQNSEQFMCDAQSIKTRLPELETLKPNAFGLYGMLGTVWEWTSSLYIPYPASTGDERDNPTLPGRRTARGGSFRTDRDAIGCGVRHGLEPDQRYDDVGFRIVRFLR